MNILIVTLMASFGFSFIYFSWQSQDNESKWIKWIGWFLVVSSIALLALATGIEFGVAYGLFGLALIPLGLVMINGDVRKEPNRSTTERNTLNQRQPFSIRKIKKSALKNIIYFVVVVPVGLISSLLTLLSISSLSNITEVNKLALIVLCFPFLWATTSYLYLYSQRKKLFGSALTLSALALSAITFT